MWIVGSRAPLGRIATVQEPPEEIILDVDLGEIERVVQQIREVWPEMKIIFEEDQERGVKPGAAVGG